MECNQFIHLTAFFFNKKKKKSVLLIITFSLRTGIFLIVFGIFTALRY